MLKKILIASLLLLVPALPAQAAGATQADATYVQSISTAAGDFGKVSTEWATAVSNPPTFAIGGKYNSWKKGAIAATTKLQAATTKLNSVKATPAFAKSDVLLKKACKEYLAGLALVSQALAKNDSKMFAKANTALNAANTSFTNWSTAYQADAKALNG
jgi:hypothetical protein